MSHKLKTNMKIVLTYDAEYKVWNSEVFDENNKRLGRFRFEEYIERIAKLSLKMLEDES